MLRRYLELSRLPERLRTRWLRAVLQVELTTQTIHNCTPLLPLMWVPDELLLGFYT